VKLDLAKAISDREDLLGRALGCHEFPPTRASGRT
jgi:hypothetical protein